MTTKEEWIQKVSAFKLLSRTIRLDPPQAEMLWGNVDKSKSFAKELRKEIKAYEAETGETARAVTELDIYETSDWIKEQLK